jgi:hypothetical protein
MSITERRARDLIAYAEARGWTTKKFEPWIPTLLRKQERFWMVLTRVDGEGFAALHYSVLARIGSGRISGTFMSFGLGVDRKTKFGNWNHLQITLNVYGKREGS